MGQFLDLHFLIWAVSVWILNFSNKTIDIFYKKNSSNNIRCHYPFLNWKRKQKGQEVLVLDSYILGGPLKFVCISWNRGPLHANLFDHFHVLVSPSTSSSYKLAVGLRWKLSHPEWKFKFTVRIAFYKWKTNFRSHFLAILLSISIHNMTKFKTYLIAFNWDLPRQLTYFLLWSIYWQENLLVIHSKWYNIFVCDAACYSAIKKFTHWFLPPLSWYLYDT